MQAAHFGSVLACWDTVYAPHDPAEDNKGVNRNENWSQREPEPEQGKETEPMRQQRLKQKQPIQHAVAQHQKRREGWRGEDKGMVDSGTSRPWLKRNLNPQFINTEEPPAPGPATLH